MIEQAKQVSKQIRNNERYRDHVAADTIDALVAEVERLKQEPVHVRERWNIETDGDDLLICFNMHDKHEKCDYQRYTPKQEQAEPVVELGDGFMFCSACKSVQDSAHHTSPHDHDVWCSGIAQWVQGPFYTAPKEDQAEPYTYASKQATKCAQCGEHKHTPLRIDAMGGYVCLTCIDKKLGSLLGEFGYPEPEQEQAEPVAWMYHDASSIESLLNNERNGLPVNSTLISFKRRAEYRNETPLYAAPQGQTELLKQALEALQYLDVTAEHKVDGRIAEVAITAIKQHLGEA